MLSDSKPNPSVNPSVPAMFKRRHATVIVLALAPCGGALATSPTGLGVDYFTTDGQRSEIGTGLSGMTDTILSEILADPANKECRIDQIEIRRTAERQRELELGRSPQVDPRSRVVDRTIPLGHRITGTVIGGADGASFVISLVNAQSGEVVGSVTGRGSSLPEIEASLREGLNELVQKLCPNMYEFKASIGQHFRIDSKVCGIDRPFKVNPRGGFSGLTLQFAPASTSGGTYTQSGRAYGTSWTGGGEYRIAWSGDRGQLTASDRYTVENAAGRGDRSATMTGTVVRLKQRCTR